MTGNCTHGSMIDLAEYQVAVAERDTLRALVAAALRDRHKDCAPWSRTGHSGCDVPDALVEVVGLLPVAIRERDALAELVRDVARSGVELDDARLSYVTIQVDRETWEQCRAVLAAEVPK